MPPFIHKVIDSVVAEEVEGLGECLNICAQRSRTLKLLGFQHLHFDARLQAFLETRAPGVVRPVMEALFLAKAFFAFRAATEQNFLWRWLERRQHRLRAAVDDAADLGAACRAAALRARDQLDQRLALFQLTLLHVTFAGWRRSVLETRADKLQQQLDEATRSSQQAARAVQVAQALRDRIGRQSSSQLLQQCLKVWFGESVAARRTKLQKIRILGLAADSSELLLQRCLAAWGAEVDEVKRHRTAEQTSVQLSRELREKKAETLLHLTSTLTKQGTRLDVCFMNWHLVVAKVKFKLRTRDKILHTMVACDEPLKMMCFTAWRNGVDAIRQEWAGRAAVREKQFATTVLTVMSCDKAFSVTALHAWRTFVEFSQQLKLSKNHHLAQALKCFDDSMGALRAHAFHSWRHCMALQQRKRLLDEHHQLEAVSAAMQKKSEAWRHKHDDVLNWKFAFLGGQCCSACFSNWRVHVQSRQQERRCRKRELEAQLHRTTVAHRMLLLQGFRAFCEELAEARHERSLGEATKTLELTGTHLQELKLASELESEHQRQKTLTALSRHFTKSGKDLLRWYLSKWVSVHVAELSITEEASKRKAQTMSQTLAVVMKSNQAFLCMVVSSWARASAQEKYERALKVSNRHLSEKTDSAAECVAYAHEKVLQAFQKQFVAMARQLLGACLSSWQDTIVRHRAWREKKAQNMQRGLLKIRIYESSMKAACLQSWSSATVDAKRERQLEDAKQRLEDTSRHLEERTRRLEETSRRLEEATTIERRAQARKREARIAVVSRQLVKTVLEQRHTYLAAWHTVVKIARHARTQRVQHMSIAKGSIANPREATLLLQCLSSWVRAAMAEKHGRMLDDANRRLQFCSASAEEDAARQQQRMLETLERQFSMWAWQLSRSCMDQWKCFLRGVHGKKSRKDLSFSTARYRIDGNESAVLAQCVAFWVGATLKGRFEKATAESYGVFRAAALKRNRMAAMRISKLLRRLLVGQCVAGWRLAMRLSVQLTEDRRRFMRCAMLGRAYIIRLRGKITEQAVWLRWHHYWQTHSKAALASKEAEQEKREFSKDPPRLFIRPASARARIFNAQAPLPVEAMQRKISDTPPLNSSDCAMEVSAGWTPVCLSNQDHLFSKVDANGDGVSSREELEGFVEESERHGLESMQQNGELESAVVLAPAAVVMPTSVASQTREAGPLAPADRRALANRAIVSESSYHALLQHNRRELREGGKSSVPARDAGWGSWAA